MLQIQTHWSSGELRLCHSSCVRPSPTIDMLAFVEAFKQYGMLNLTFSTFAAVA